MSKYSKYKFDLVTINGVQFECYYLAEYYDSHDGKGYAVELFHAEINGDDLFTMLNLETIRKIESEIASMLSE